MKRKQGGQIKHGHSIRGQWSPEYSTWTSMRTRCEKKSYHLYKYYGARGIKICKRWAEFQNFYDDMGPKPTPEHSLDRIDNSKGYEPSNCKWATKKEQSRNTRSNKLIEYNGETKCVAEWAEEAKVSEHAFRNRISRGWTIEDALTKRKMTREEISKLGNDSKVRS